LAVHVATADQGYDCDTCRYLQCDEDGTREWTTASGEARKSQGPAPFPRWDFSAYSLPKLCTCPLMLVPDEWPMLSALYSAWTQGALYCHGGISDQPGVYVDAMILLGAELRKIEKRRLDEARKTGR
jgi:hypothetical protein